MLPVPVRNDFAELPQILPQHLSLRGSHETLADDDILAAHTLLGVGAIYNPEKGIKPRDGIFMREGLACAEEIGLRVSTTVIAAMANLLQGFDYNTADHLYSADIVVLCFIPWDGHPDSFMSCSIISPIGHGDNFWRNRIAEARPKIVISIENDYPKKEIIAWNICPDTYKKGPAFDAEFDLSGTPYDKGKAAFVAHTIVRSDVAAALDMPLVSNRHNRIPRRHPIQDPNYFVGDDLIISIADFRRRQFARRNSMEPN